MGKHDELDASRAQAFAWRVYRPGEPFEPPEIEPDPEIDPPDEDAGDASALPSLEAFRRDAVDACAALAAGVDRAWMVAEPAQQAAAVSELLRRAGALGISLTAIHDRPLQSVRLVRLAVRIGERLTAADREAACQSLPWLDYSHPEVADLLVEVAEAADRRLAGSLLIALHTSDVGPRLGRVRDLSARLARILDDGPSWDARVIAVGWLHEAAERSAIPALRRALRFPHLELRWRALWILRERFEASIEPDDVVFLLEDAVIHPYPDEFATEQLARAHCYHPGDLLDAITRLRPPRGEAPLRRILEGSCVHAGYRHRGLDAAWALRALAAGYPDRAAREVDRRFESADARDRVAAVEAAVHLPDAAAWPRLLRGAADGAPSVSGRARKLWLDRRGETCPAGELDGLLVELLPARASDRLCARLTALRVGSAEARQALAEVLLGEAPDREALALLLFALDDEDLWGIPRRPGLPDGRIEWCRELVARFGLPAIEGLCALAARRLYGRLGWLYGLNALLDAPLARALPEGSLDPLRRLALRAVDAGVDDVWEAWSILARTGAPPAFYARAWAVAFDRGVDEAIRDGATRALVAWPRDDPRADADVLQALSSSLAEGDLDRFARAAEIGLGRHTPAVAARVARAVRELSSRPFSPALCRALAGAAQHLRGAHRLPDAWLVEALSRPESCAFGVALELVHGDGDVAPPVRRALRGALGSPARGGAAAAEAAQAMLDRHLIGPHNRQLGPIFEAAPPAARGALLTAFIHRKVPLEAVWPSVAALLTSADPAITAPFEEDLCRLPWRRLGPRILELAPRVVAPGIRGTIDLYLERRTEADLYWQDPREERRRAR
jgi:hypothetical protein